MWTVQFRDRRVKRFKFPIRSTAWGSIEPYEGMPEPDSERLGDPHLCGEETWLGVDTLPVPAAAATAGQRG
jgi:adenylylsulfate reductase subunit B